MAEGKPSVLIIGGLGYIGRFLALHIHENELASEVRLVDKQLPQLAWLAPEFKDACSMDKFKQGDMTREQTVAKMFDREGGSTWDFVFNCGGETRFSQEEEVYRHRSFNLSIACGREAAKRNVKLFVELSEGGVYDPGSKPRKETAKLKPSLKLFKYKQMAEEELQKIEGLNLMIVRLANVYGNYSNKYVAVILCNARVYQKTEEEMKFLWSKDMKTNTVHISDTVRALWHGAEWFAKGKPGWDESWGPTPIFNVVDDGDTSQRMMADGVAKIFDIKTGFHGTIVSTFARMNLDSAVDDANEDVLQPWAEALTEAGITRPGPITPFLEQDLLRENDLSMDGSRFKSVTGFTYDNPKITEDSLRGMIESYKRMNWWP